MARGWILAVLLAAAHSAAAGSFSVAPIRVEMTPGHQRGVFTLHNDAAIPVTVQVSTAAWTQQGGDDHYAPTHELIATPPVFVVAPDSNQIVRVALQREPDAKRELAYRVFFQEVPQTVEKSFNGLQVALRVGVPVFVAPSAASATAALSWQIHQTAPTEYSIDAVNNGGAHLQVMDFTLELGPKAEAVHVGGAHYVLPGCTMSWKLTLPTGTALAEPLRVRGLSDHGDFTAPVARATS